jgi:DNA-binding transcriptional MocR family regulator
VSLHANHDGDIGVAVHDPICNNWVVHTQAGPVMGAARFALLVEGWREGVPGRLPRRLAHTIRARILSGLLPAGVVLPPERSVAAELGVSRSTVVAAFDELRAGGLLDSRQGSGTWVATATDVSDARAHVATRLLAGAANVNLAASVPSDASHLPPLRLEVADLVAAVPAHGYVPAGLPVLREAIAARHCALGLPTGPEQVHVTNGAQHALDLALGALTRPGDVVAIEDPTYVGVLDLLDARGLRGLPIVLADFDEDSDRLLKLLRGGRVRAALLVPAVHSPTGQVRTAAAMQRLAGRLDAAHIPVIEDNTVADLVFRGTRPPSLAALCTRAAVISIETTSKVAWGGLRVGWLRADTALVEHTVTERARTDFGTSVPSQLLALRLLEQYDDLVEQRRHSLRLAATTFTRLLHDAFPRWNIQRPAGGLSLWVDTGVDTEQLAAHALRHGVTIAPGTTASVGATARSYLRLCFDRPLVELETGVARLRRAYEDATGWREQVRHFA